MKRFIVLILVLTSGMSFADEESAEQVNLFARQLLSHIEKSAGNLPMLSLFNTQIESLKKQGFTQQPNYSAYHGNRDWNEDLNNYQEPKYLNLDRYYQARPHESAYQDKLQLLQSAGKVVLVVSLQKPIDTQNYFEAQVRMTIFYFHSTDEKTRQSVFNTPPSLVETSFKQGTRN